MRYIHFTYPTTRGSLTENRLAGRFGSPALQNDIDWLFGTALTGFSGGAQFPVDLFEDKDNTYVRAELPGVARDAINVEFVDGSLSIQATRKEKSGETETEASYSRVVAVPSEIQADKIAAAYENGVLTVTIPRREESKPRKINVAVS